MTAPTPPKEPASAQDTTLPSTGSDSLERTRSNLPQVLTIALALVVIGALIAMFTIFRSRPTETTAPAEIPPEGLAAASAAAASHAAAAGGGGAAGGAKLNIDYVPDGKQNHKLDLFLPTGAGAAPYPLVIFVHGGGWRLGDKSTWSGGEGDLKAEQTKDMLMKNGFATASINYQLYNGDQKSYPGNVHDVKAAIRFLRVNAGSYGLNANRFAIFGESAGGHLAELMGTTGNVHNLDGELGYNEANSSVQAVVSYYGFSDLGARTSQQLAQGCTPDTKGFTSQGKMLGAEPDTTAKGKQLAKEASAITYVDPKDPPMLLVHGTKDCVAPPAQSKNMAAELKRVGVPVELTLIDAGHADPIFYTDPKLQKNLLTFLQNSMKAAS